MILTIDIKGVKEVKAELKRQMSNPQTPPREDQRLKSIKFTGRRKGAYGDVQVVYAYREKRNSPKKSPSGSPKDKLAFRNSPLANRATEVLSLKSKPSINLRALCGCHAESS